MMVVDIETSGLQIGRNGIWQIGAVDMKTGEEFFEEGCIDENDEIMEEALKLCGKTEEELRDKKKQTQKQLIENFLNWLKKFDERILAGQNIGFDIMFIQEKCIEYNLRDKFQKITGQRSIDLHTLAQLKFKKEHGRFKTENGKSTMNLKSVLEMCGIEDKRKQVVNKKITEGRPHNALEDAKLTAKCFRKLLGEEK